MKSSPSRKSRNSSIRRSSAIRAGCICGWPSPSPPTWSPRSFWWMKCLRWALRAPSAEAVDQYMTSGMAQEGERSWDGDPRVGAAAPFRPLALRVRDSQGRVSAQVASAAACAVEFEYALEADVTGLRVGLYLMTSQGGPAFASFATH